ncbi:unnamed protein product [Acanthosepion pharaonis]|uniref:Ubiquitin-like domain-containing protein n=1 Tax=Acanthosepion pharaonis TaxID=158019 RepID=A0A812BAY3_ACAPH|nr:unnamed protein product [Sepia pharaonis]
MTVKELRKLVELATGIPYDLQRLTYLDEAELVDSTTLRENEIVPGGTLNLSVWYIWLELVERAIMGDIPNLLKLGVSPIIPFSSPITEYMDEKTKLAWTRKKAFVVLCIAANRENLLLCQEMMPCIEKVNMRTPIGRTALHIAASQGRCEMLKLLLENGAKLNLTDIDGFKPLDIAILFGRQEAERLLFMVNWKMKMERAQAATKKRELLSSSKKEESVTDDILPELTSETQLTAPEIDKAKVMKDELQIQTVPKTPVITAKEVTTSAPNETVGKKEEEIKAIAKSKSKVDNVSALGAENHPPDGYNKDPDSFRRYLVSLKRQFSYFSWVMVVGINQPKTTSFSS